MKDFWWCGAYCAWRPWERPRIIFLLSCNTSLERSWKKESNDIYQWYLVQIVAEKNESSFQRVLFQISILMFQTIWIDRSAPNTPSHSLSHQTAIHLDFWLWDISIDWPFCGFAHKCGSFVRLVLWSSRGKGSHCFVLFHHTNCPSKLPSSNSESDWAGCEICFSFVIREAFSASAQNSSWIFIYNLLVMKADMTALKKYFIASYIHTPAVIIANHYFFLLNRLAI